MVLSTEFHIVYNIKHFCLGVTSTNKIVFDEYKGKNVSIRLSAL